MVLLIQCTVEGEGKDETSNHYAFGIPLRVNWKQIDLSVNGKINQTADIDPGFSAINLPW